jgi:UDP-glucuronate decarboxylase
MRPGKSGMIDSNRILQEDLNHIYDRLTEKEFLAGTKILVTGCAGFLGFYLMEFLNHFSYKLGIKSVIGVDNFLLGKPHWLELLEKGSAVNMRIYHFNIAQDDIQRYSELEDFNIVIHMASIASPTFYRKYPIETVDANVWGLRTLLEYYKSRDLKRFLFFSSSEVYGDPSQEHIPTGEEYRGNVSAVGPRACYDEAKRFGETLCYIYAQYHNMPIVIVRPFNNYGPGMRFEDKRVPADFAKAVFENRDIKIYSDGTPTRTFCYVADAITGYLQALTSDIRFDYFNIGIDRPEISVRELADIFAQNGQEIMDYKCRVMFEKPMEKEYLTHNPSRRCPDISKAREKLHFHPSIEATEGVGRFLEFIKISKGIL